MADKGSKMTKRIKELREEKKISFAEFEKLTGISRSALQRYESKNAYENVPINKLHKIADSLEVTPMYLMGWEGRETSYEDIKAVTSILRNYDVIVEYDDDSKNYIIFYENKKFSISQKDIKKLNDNVISYFGFLFDKSAKEI